MFLSSTKKSVINENWVDQPQIGGFSAMIKNNLIDIEITGQLNVYKEYKIRQDRIIGFWMDCIKIGHSL